MFNDLGKWFHIRPCRQAVHFGTGEVSMLQILNSLQNAASMTIYLTPKQVYFETGRKFSDLNSKLTVCKLCTVMGNC